MHEMLLVSQQLLNGDERRCEIRGLEL